MKLKKPNDTVGATDLNKMLTSVYHGVKRSDMLTKSHMDELNKLSMKDTKAAILEEVRVAIKQCDEMRELNSGIISNIKAFENENADHSDLTTICVDQCAAEYLEEWTNWYRKKMKGPLYILEEPYATCHLLYIKSRMKLDLYGVATYNLYRWGSFDNNINTRLYKKHLRKYLKTHKKVKPYSRIV